MKTVRTILEPQVAEVPLKSDDALSRVIELGRPHSGPIMRALVTRRMGPDRVSMAVYAHESDLPLMDLSFLRLMGAPCAVGQWEPKAPHQGIDGPLMKPCFQLVPGAYGFEVELTHLQPRSFREAVGDAA